jgi:TonB family protein
MPVTARAVAEPAEERLPKPAASESATVYRKAEQVFQPLRSGEDADESEGKGKHKGKAAFISFGVIALVLIVGSLGYFKLHAGTSAANSPVVPAQTITNSPTMDVDPQMSTGTPANTGAADAAKAASAATNAKPEAATETGRALRAQAALMNQQLNAPKRIPNDLKILAGRETAPSSGFSASGMDSMGGNSNVFSGQTGSKVKVEVAKKVAVSAGVATGLLIRRTTPIYPAIAKSAHVSGTVEIQATISKTGTIENLHAVSGPAMLRQSALDAVKTWRYKPYLLDGEPVAIDTTVDVVFNSGQ